MTPEEIAELTGLVYCGPDCGCGNNSGLLYFPVEVEPEPWVPAWMNGAEPHGVEEWLRENGKVESP